MSMPHPVEHSTHTDWIQRSGVSRVRSSTRAGQRARYGVRAAQMSVMLSRRSTAAFCLQPRATDGRASDTIAAAMIGLTRRQCCARLAGLVSGLALGGCVSVSPQEERRVGDREADEVERSVGLVRDARLVEYVAAIGTRLAQAAGRPDIAWQWSVADEPDANAFALPGGWVYVTRGLLTLANREDELAGVLGHEMAHVLEHHAVSRERAATPLAVLFGVPSGILGIVSPSLGGIVGGAGRVVSGLALAPYSRDQERAADRIGVALCARAGWDPRALADMLGSLERAESLGDGGASRGRSFFATHPSTPDRVASIHTAVASLSQTSVAPIAGSRAALLGRLDGLVIGNPAANGLFVGRRFVNVDFDVAVEMPDRWKTASSRRAAGAVAPDDTAVVLFHLVGNGDDPVAGARADGLSDAQIERIRRLPGSSLPAATLAGATRDGTRVTLTWIAHRQRIFRVTGVCEAAAWERYRGDFERTAASCRPLSGDDAARVTERRLRIRSARAGETIAQILARGGAAWSADEAAVANGVSTSAPLAADWPVKIAVSERYRGVARPGDAR
jgi:predicted Zn-dependent protease